MDFNSRRRSSQPLSSPCLKPGASRSFSGDVWEWFKSQGRGYQTLINTLLRSYMKAHQ
ncbi:BrnA antitoxin family protein [Microcoleus sp. herbarium7]